MKVSVVMTVYGKEDFLKEAIESILDQTYSDFEFIIVIEAGADLDTVKTVEEYALMDVRIKRIYNKERLGLAKSLNIGIMAAKGEYIARMDDDDWSERTRFEKQVTYLDTNQDVGICGTLQRTIRPDREMVLRCATKPEDLKAEMLFGCQLSHTSVMFRRKLFLDNKWLYNADYLAEDYHLWSDIVDKTSMANIDEALVKHRYGFGNISLAKGEKLYQENVRTIKSSLSRYLGIDSMEWSDFLFGPWRSYREIGDIAQKGALFIENIFFLQQLEQANWNKAFVSQESFCKLIWKRWREVTANRLGLCEFAALLDRWEKDDKKTFAENMSDVLQMLGIEVEKSEEPVFEIRNLSHLGIPESSKVMIYGLGNAYGKFKEMYGEEIITSRYTLIGVTDRDEMHKYYVQNFVEKERLRELEFDYILISSGRYFKEIREELFAYYDIPRKKIKLLEQIIFE